MNDNPSPFGIHPDDQLEARLTAWVLGEASPFEIAELESLVAKSPELQLFLSRTRALHALLQEAETTANQPDEEWKLHPGRKFKIARAFGENPEIPRLLPLPEKESRIRRASFRAAWGIAAVFVVTFFSLRLLPGDFEAEAVIEIRPRERAIHSLAGETSQERAMTPMFFGTEFEKIKSRNSLEKVVDDLDLTARWKTDKETALKRLKDSVETKNIRGTDLISIRVRQPDEQDAKEITRAVTEGYRDYRSSLEEKAAERGLAELRKAVREQEDKVQERRKVLTTISRTKDIIYYGDRNEDRLPEMAMRKKETKKESLERSIDTTDYVDAKRDFETDLALLENMKLKLITEEIAGELPNESIVIHDEPTVARRTFPANPIAALKRALATDTKSSEPLALAEMAAVEPSPERAKPLAAKPASPAQIPAPEIATLEPSTDFGDGDDFGGGFGVKGNRSGDKAITRNSIDSILNNPGRAAAADKPAVHIGGHVKETGPVEFKDGLTLQEAVVQAGGTTEFGSRKRVKLYREGKALTYNLDDEQLAQIKLRPDDTIEIPQKNWLGCGASRNEVLNAPSEPPTAMAKKEADFGDADESGALADAGGFARGGAPGSAGSDKGSEYRSNSTIVDSGLLSGNAAIPNNPATPAPAASEPIADARRHRQSAIQPETKKGEANERADLFAESSAPGEIGSLTRLFSSGSTEGRKSLDTFTGYRMDRRAGAERSDDYFDSDFEGYVNYGAPIAGELTGENIPKFTEITQANNKELGFDWILPLDGKADPFWDTSDAVATAEGKGGVEYEIHTGYTSEYLFRGLAFPEEQQLIDLADLSQEIPAAQEPFSTFSLNISDASFQLALAAVEKGERPDPASIKPEQFYNAVDYGDPAPSSLEPVAAAIDQTAHPVIPGRNLVRVAIRTASTGRSAAQPLRLTLLVDQSGSMARADRRAAMDTALAQLATLLTENDRITVIGFSRTPRLIADSLPGNEAAKIPDLVNTTASEGGTNLEQAFNLSSELALRHKLDGAQNRIVLFTDGAANLGDADPDRLAGRVKELRQQGLAFDIAGIGTNDTNDRLLSELARHGNGRYYLVGENTGTSLAAQLAGAFRPAAENVKVQVKLNPERVGNYKLIGFEKDRLKTEDFRDDSVDAAELAADEAGVAIYQVETLPEGTGEIGEVSVRFRDTASGEMVERAWTIPHDPTTPSFDKAAPQTQLATLALLAAQKLQGGPLAEAIRFPDHAETIAKLKQTYVNDEKALRLLTLINTLK